MDKLLPTCCSWDKIFWAQIPALNELPLIFRWYRHMGLPVNICMDQLSPLRLLWELSDQILQESLENLSLW